MAGDLSRAPAPKAKAPGAGGPNLNGMENVTKVLTAVKDVGTDLLKGNLPGAALKMLDKVADLANSMHGSAGFTKQLTGYTSALGGGNPLAIAQKGVQVVTSGGQPGGGGGGPLQAASKGGEAALGAASKAADAASTAGSAVSTAGSATQAAAAGGKAAGVGLKAGGGLLSMTLIGSIVGIPMKVVGAGTTAVATGTSAAGTGMKLTGTAVKTSAKVTKTVLKSVQTVLKTVRKTVEGLRKGIKAVQKPLKLVSRAKTTLQRPLEVLGQAKAHAGKALRVTKKTTKTIAFPAKTALRLGSGLFQKAKNLATASHDLSNAAIQAGKGDLSQGVAHLKTAGQKTTSARELTAPVKQTVSEGKAIHASWRGQRPAMPSEQRTGMMQRLLDGQAKGQRPSATGLSNAMNQPPSRVPRMRPAGMLHGTSIPTYPEPELI